MAASAAGTAGPGSALAGGAARVCGSTNQPRHTFKKKRTRKEGAEDFSALVLQQGRCAANVLGDCCVSALTFDQQHMSEPLTLHISPGVIKSSRKRTEREKNGGACSTMWFLAHFRGPWSSSSPLFLVQPLIWMVLMM